MTGKIVNFVTGLLPKKKNGGYYLQLEDETKEVKPKVENKKAQSKTTETTETLNGSKPVEAAVAEAPAAAKAAVKETVAAATDVVEKTVEKVEKTVEKAEKAVEKAAPKSAKSKTKAVKTESAQNGKAPAAKPASPAPKPAAVTPALPPETAFASKYLVPTNTNGRRRPGPSMNPFMDMARQAKTPNK
ncbi:MAG: hypothetical protein KME64_11125 [Scytonematopsis contorta HA4267-MV1]|jgi:cytoskeletal protein RodZ|nr:hypothetical protein [Scytonematopsis contorta HA4267-MV1]